MCPCRNRRVVPPTRCRASSSTTTGKTILNLPSGFDPRLVGQVARDHITLASGLDYYSFLPCICHGRHTRASSENDTLISWLGPSASALHNMTIDDQRRCRKLIKKNKKRVQDRRALTRFQQKLMPQLRVACSGSASANASKQSAGFECSVFKFI